MIFREAVSKDPSGSSASSGVDGCGTGSSRWQLVTANLDEVQAFADLLEPVTTSSETFLRDHVKDQILAPLRKKVRLAEAAAKRQAWAARSLGLDMNNIIGASGFVL
jgi:hypothetical protein